MKIGINTFGCDHGRSGIGSYILSLVHNMPKTVHKIHLFGPELDKYTYTSGVAGITYTGIPINGSAFSEKTWFAFSFNKFVRKQQYDVVLFPAGLPTVPRPFDVPIVPVIQNVVDRSKGYFNSLFSKHFLYSFQGIICPSSYIYNQILDLGIPSSKLKVIHNGIDTTLFYPCGTQNNDALLVQPFAIKRPYIMYASRISYPEKCHVELINAFTLFKQKTHAPHKLVIAGADGKNSEIVHQAVLRSPVASDILLTGYFPHQNLPHLYSAADLCVFPSPVEGVGLPVIEAMACGIPTACAYAGALPEIAGDCTCYFNHKNPAEIAAVIEQLIDAPIPENQEKRKMLIAKGIEWTKQYSWKKTAEETLAYLSRLK